MISGGGGVAINSWRPTPPHIMFFLTSVRTANKTQSPSDFGRGWCTAVVVMVEYGTQPRGFRGAAHLDGAQDLAEVANHVVVHRVGEMVQEVLEGALLGHGSLSTVPKNGNHGKASVLDLLLLHVLHL
jgi:hypothetical protein